jgi:NTE family protein
MTMKIGLILAGGGAKGAYQSGVVKYLAEIDFVPQMIAGTSIGALNGAILASHAPFKHAADRLWELWTELSQADIIRSQIGRYLLQALASIKHIDDPSLFDPTPLEAFLEYAVNPQQLRRGIELWVAAFPSAHNSSLVSLQDRGQIVSTLANFVNSHRGQSANYIHVQSAKTDAEIYQTLLASAAIPMAFSPRKVEGVHYVDGWLGDNVPLKALAQRGCTHAIVIHLENGELWSRHDFPNQTIIEIRPQKDIGGLTTLLDFSPDRVSLLQERGYQDAKRCLEPIFQTFSIEYSRRESLDRLQETTKRLRDDPPVY